MPRKAVGIGMIETPGMKDILIVDTIRAIHGTINILIAGMGRNLPITIDTGETEMTSGTAETLIGMIISAEIAMTGTIVSR